MATMKISLIPNDFSMDLERVFQLCREENVKYVELGFMWNKSILDLTEKEIEQVLALLEKYELKVASIQTQIMKVFPPGSKLAKPGSKNMHRDFEYNINQIDRAIELTTIFDTKYIITYSFFRFLTGISEKNWNLMFEIYGKMIEKLEAAKKIAVVECEGDTYVGTIKDYLRLFEEFKSPSIRANFDLANLLSAQPQFTRDNFDQFHEYVNYFHIKDKKYRKFLKWLPIGGSVFGEGEVPWKEVLPWFKEIGFDGFVSVEPHVHGKEKFENGRKCVQHLQKMLIELQIPFE
jgi:L-ribulose-5-phosphate 3-epimerase